MTPCSSSRLALLALHDALWREQNRMDAKKPISAEEAVRIVKVPLSPFKPLVRPLSHSCEPVLHPPGLGYVMQDTFIVATERDIHTGDSVEIRVITKVCLRLTRL
jgi:hypothetical protein